MPIEKPTIEKEKIEEEIEPTEEKIGPEAIETKEPQIETEIQPEKEITFEQMQQDKEKVIDGVIIKLGRVSRKAKMLIAGAALMTVLAAGPKETKAEEIPQAVKVGAVIFGRIFGILKSREEIEVARRIENTRIELTNLNQEYAKNYASFRIDRALDKQRFNLKKHSEEEKKEFDLEQTRQRMNFIKDYDDRIDRPLKELGRLGVPEKEITKLEEDLRTKRRKIEFDEMARKLSRLLAEGTDIEELIKILNISKADLLKTKYFEVQESEKSK